MAVHPVTNRVRRVGLPRVPPEVFDAIVITIAVVVAGHGPFRAGADEHPKDEMVDRNGDKLAGPAAQSSDVMTVASARMEASPRQLAPSGP